MITWPRLEFVRLNRDKAKRYANQEKGGRPYHPAAGRQKQKDLVMTEDNSSKKALITGVTGQDGAYLSEFLLREGL